MIRCGCVVQVVREASWRVLGLRPFDVQLMGGIILHEGQIAEMRTGEVHAAGYRDANYPQENKYMSVPLLYLIC